MPQIELTSRCASDVLLPTGDLEINDQFAPGVPNYKEFLYGTVQLSGESQGFDGNGPYLRFQGGGGPVAVQMNNPSGSSGDPTSPVTGLRPNNVLYGNMSRRRSVLSQCSARRPPSTPAPPVTRNRSPTCRRRRATPARSAHRPHRHESRPPRAREGSRGDLRPDRGRDLQHDRDPRRPADDLPSWVPLFGGDRFELKAEFSSAQAVTPGQGQSVDIAGIRVGEVTGVELENGDALVTMEVDNKYAPLIHDDATLLLRPKTGLNDMVIQLDLGTGPGTVEEGATIPLASTQPNVIPDEFLATLDADTRSFLKLLLAGGAEGLGGKHGLALSAVLRRFEPTARDLARINGALAQRRESIARSIHNFRLVADELASKDQTVADFVDSSNAVLASFADQEASLARRLQRAARDPEADARDPDQHQSVRQGRRAGAAQAAALCQGAGAGAAADPPLPAPDGCSDPRSDPAVHPPDPHAGLPPAAARHSARQYHAAAESRLPVAQSPPQRSAYNPPGAQEGYLFWLPWLNHNTNMLFRAQDAHGPLRMGTVMITCGTTTLAEGLIEGRPFLKTLFQINQGRRHGAGLLMRHQRITTAQLAAAIGFAFSCFGLLLFLWTAFGGPIPFKPEGYRIKVPVDEGTQLAQESDVRISNVSVGKVKDIVLGDEGDQNGLAVATIEIDAPYSPLPSDTRATLRQKTLLGETYMELTPGNPDSGEIPEGGSLPRAQTSNGVQLDEIFRTFDPRTRAAFQQWMQGAAIALNGRGQTSMPRSATSMPSPRTGPGCCACSIPRAARSQGSFATRASSSTRSPSARDS